MLKLLVIGLDGATWEVMQPLIDTGQLPHLRRLMNEGTWGKLRSTIPPVTAPAWSGFMTGLNPGRHGIFQWRTYDPTNYTCLDERLMTSERLAGRTFWDVLGRAGYRVAILTVPMTYPTWPVNGYLLAGYPCPDAKQNYAYPAEWAETLNVSYNFTADYYLNASEDEIWREGLAMLERRTSLALDLITGKELDACVLVLGEIDRAQHDFWQYADPRFPQHHTTRGQRYRQVIADHYRASDVQIGRLLKSVSDETTVLIISDHGAGPHPPRYFHTNAWLEERGWLRRRRALGSAWHDVLRRTLQATRRLLPSEERLRQMLPTQWVHSARRLSLNIADIAWAETLAYRFPMYHPAEGIEINLRGRQPEGVVEPGADCVSLREEIIAALQATVDPQTGQPVARAVYRREELYTGEYAGIAPDIVFLTNEDYKAESGLGGASITPVPLGDLRKYNGLHRMDGILLARGPHIPARQAGEANILDIASTILYALGEPIPAATDGRPLLSLFEPGFVQANPPRCVEIAPSTPLGPVELADEDAEEMRKKLQGLGYLS